MIVARESDMPGLWWLEREEDGRLVDIALLEGGFTEETARYIAACMSAFEGLPKADVVAGKFKVVPVDADYCNPIAALRLTGSEAIPLGDLSGYASSLRQQRDLAALSRR